MGVNTLSYASSVSLQRGVTISMRYKYVAGYCNPSSPQRKGAMLAVKVGGVILPGMTAGPFDGISKSDYPYDRACGGCPTCYSPWIVLTSTALQGPAAGPLEITFTNNDRNMHLVVDWIKATAQHTHAPTPMSPTPGPSPCPPGMAAGTP